MSRFLDTLERLDESQSGLINTAVTLGIVLSIVGFAFLVTLAWRVAAS